MTFKILALILSLVSMTVALSRPWNPASPSDAYQVGYAEGRFDLYTESKAIKKFNQCVAEKKEAPEACGVALLFGGGPYVPCQAAGSAGVFTVCMLTAIFSA